MNHLILCIYGRAGYELLNYLYLNNFKRYIPIIFTHKVNNELLLKHLDILKISYYTESINKHEDVVKAKNGIMLSVHYRNIIKKHILDAFDGVCINAHPSLLPKYKGCFSAPWAIINNESETGVTFHEMTPNVDEGRIIHQIKCKVSQYDTGYSLYHKLITLCIHNIDFIFDNKIEFTSQVGEGSYYKREVPYNGIIDKRWTIDKQERFKRALYFPPFPPVHE